MRRPTRALTLLGLAAIGMASLAGCGDTTADEPTAGPADCAAGAGETVTVEIPEFMFEPTPVDIEACDSVVWKNTHDQAHTSTGKGDKAWSTGNIAAGSESDPVLFEEPGSFAYICALHPFMEGTVEVA
ncbi:MAG: plastocyanin/azurin family copper-binding protein [Acidimicrobiales bacterium]